MSGRSGSAMGCRSGTTRRSPRGSGPGGGGVGWGRGGCCSGRGGGSIRGRGISGASCPWRDGGGTGKGVWGGGLAAGGGGEKGWKRVSGVGLVAFGVR